MCKGKCLFVAVQADNVEECKAICKSQAYDMQCLSKSGRYGNAASAYVAKFLVNGHLWDLADCTIDDLKKILEEGMAMKTYSESPVFAALKNINAPPLDIINLMAEYGLAYFDENFSYPLPLQDVNAVMRLYELGFRHAQGDIRIQPDISNAGIEFLLSIGAISGRTEHGRADLTAIAKRYCQPDSLDVGITTLVLTHIRHTRLDVMNAGLFMAAINGGCDTPERYALVQSMAMLTYGHTYQRDVLMHYLPRYLGGDNFTQAQDSALALFFETISEDAQFSKWNHLIRSVACKGMHRAFDAFYIKVVKPYMDGGSFSEPSIREYVNEELKKYICPPEFFQSVQCYQVAKKHGLPIPDEVECRMTFVRNAIYEHVPRVLIDVILAL
jgi:hypothetical protein